MFTINLNILLSQFIFFTIAQLSLRIQLVYRIWKKQTESGHHQANPNISLPLSAMAKTQVFLTGSRENIHITHNYGSL